VLFDGVLFCNNRLIIELLPFWVFKEVACGGLGAFLGIMFEFEELEKSIVIVTFCFFEKKEKSSLLSYNIDTDL